MQRGLREFKKSSTVFLESLKQLFKHKKAIAKMIAFALVVVLALQYASTKTISFYLESLTLGQLTSIQNLFYGFVLLGQFTLSVFLIKLMDNPELPVGKTIISGSFWKQAFFGLVLALLTTLAVGFASFLLLVPGIYLSIIFSFVIYIYVLENENLFDSFKKSYLLSRGFLWSIFGRILYMLALSVLIAFVSIVPVTGGLIASIASFILSLVLIFFMGLTYEELIVLKSSGVAKESISFSRKTVYVFLSILLFAGLALFSSIGSFVIDVSNSGAEVTEIDS